MFKTEDLLPELFLKDDTSSTLGRSEKSLIINIKNKVHLKNFLGKIFTPLRYTYIWDIQILSTFVKIIKFFDLPYRFDLDKNNLWRYILNPMVPILTKRKGALYPFSRWV